MVKHMMRLILLAGILACTGCAGEKTKPERCGPDNAQQCTEQADSPSQPDLDQKIGKLSSNFIACLNGEHKCNLEALSLIELQQVDESARRRNLEACESGRFSDCDLSQLTERERVAVEVAANRRNVEICFNGPLAACDWSRLTPGDQERLASILTARSTPPPNTYQQPLNTYRPPVTAYWPPAAPLRPYGCAENGSCYGDPSPYTGAPRTVPIQGYFRRDGTYVRGHYRSRPRDN